MFARVIVDITHTQVDRVFEYSIPDGMPVSLGMRVLIPFGRSKTVEGFVIGTSGTIDYDAEKIKPILSVLESFSALSAEQIELGQFIAKKYNTTLAAALRLMIPAQLRGGRVSQKTQQYVYLNVQGDAFDQAAQSLHTKDGKVKYRKQLEILERLKGAPQGLPCATFGASSIETLVKKGYVRKESKEISRLPFKMNVPQIEDYVLTPVQQAVLMKIQRAANRKFLLHGVTGSGKTEIYVRLIRQCLKSGKTAIMLVPEISLTAQTYRFLKQRFSEEMAVFHSALSAGERYDEWLKVKRGKARIVLGARSAVFAPLENIGAIIIDEEHETSYKSDQYPKYTAHEIAEKRCELNGAILVLGSATPKIETYFRAKQGKLELLRMPERLFDLPLPKVEIVDMREELKNGNRGVISGRLHEEMTAVFENKKQVMLFLNRRGYSTFVMCRGCGYTV
ncbi:MAG: replication restart helicase PriA, partial [Christensenellaceae bacterium]